MYNMIFSSVTAESSNHIFHFGKDGSHNVNTDLCHSSPQIRGCLARAGCVSLQDGCVLCSSNWECEICLTEITSATSRACLQFAG